MDNGCMAEVSPEKRLAVWQHWYGDATDGFDACGAYIERDAKADTDNAWEVDHIFPAEILEIMKVPDEMINDPANLRPLHHSNNEAKGIQYPKYTAAIVGAGKGLSRCISTDKQTELAKLYNEYITRFKNTLHTTKTLYGELSENQKKVERLLTAADLMN